MKCIVKDGTKNQVNGECLQRGWYEDDVRMLLRNLWRDRSRSRWGEEARSPGIGDHGGYEV